jgi:hypothetical protein
MPDPPSTLVRRLPSSAVPDRCEWAVENFILKTGHFPEWYSEEQKNQLRTGFEK